MKSTELTENKSTINLQEHFNYLENNIPARKTIREEFYLKYGYGMGFWKKLSLALKWILHFFKHNIESNQVNLKNKIDESSSDTEKLKLNCTLVQNDKLTKIWGVKNKLQRFQFFVKWLFEGKYGFGRSELDFIDWEIERGALDDEKGSPWWREVNFLFIVIAECAALLHENKTTEEDVDTYFHELIDRKHELTARRNDLFANELQKWKDYITEPTGQHWYRAHNSTIISGYSSYKSYAKKEIEPEQHFLNEVLYRLLFAQSMEEGATFLNEIGTYLANPKLPAVEIITSIPALYPRHYPLTQHDINHVEHKGFGIGEILERILDTIILSNIDQMYKEATGWNKTPELERYLDDKKPIYPSTLLLQNA